MLLPVINSLLRNLATDSIGVYFDSIILSAYRRL